MVLRIAAATAVMFLAPAAANSSAQVDEAAPISPMAPTSPTVTQDCDTVAARESGFDPLSPAPARSTEPIAPRGAPSSGDSLGPTLESGLPNAGGDRSVLDEARYAQENAEYNRRKSAYDSARLECRLRSPN